MEKISTVGTDSTVRSQDSNDSKDSCHSKDTCHSKDSKPDSCQESKHSKEILISERRQQQHQPHRQRQQRQDQRAGRPDKLPVKDDSSLLMLTSCGQLLLGVVLVVFGVLVLVHGASLGGSGAGLWAGAGALVAGALGVVAALATSSDKPEMGQNQRTSGFSTAHLASSLVALALSNMAAITALTAVVRDSQRNPELTLLAVPEDDGRVIEVEGGWAGLLASVGLLVASVAELLVSAYTCVTLTPKLCRCLRSGEEGAPEETGLKTHNMVHQWVIAQSHVPKNQPIYVVQPVVPVHPIMQGPYGMPPPPGKYPPGFLPAGTLPLPGAGFKVPMVAHPQYGTRPPSQMVRPKHRRHSSEDLVDSAERRRHHEGKQESPKRMSSIGEDQVDLAQTYTGLDKKISEEFISIAMDPERKSKASSHHGSEVGSAVGGKSP